MPRAKEYDSALYRIQASCEEGRGLFDDLIDEIDMKRSAICETAVALVEEYRGRMARKPYTGAQIQSLEVTRSISAKGKTRGKVAEILALFQAESVAVPEALAA